MEPLYTCHWGMAPDEWVIMAASSLPEAVAKFVQAYPECAAGLFSVQHTHNRDLNTGRITAFVEWAGLPV